MRCWRRRACDLLPTATLCVPLQDEQGRESIDFQSIDNRLIIDTSQMTTTTRRSGSAIITVTRLALLLLLSAVISAQILTLIISQGMVEDYPEFADLQLPLVSAAIAFGVCVEAVLFISAVLVGHTQDGRIFGPQALRLVDIMIGALVLATILIAVTVFVIPGPPATGLLLMGGAFVGATVTMVVLVLRMLLVRASFMRVELDEVI